MLTLQCPCAKEDQDGDLLAQTHLECEDDMQREQYQRKVSEDVEDTHAKPERGLEKVSYA